MTSFCHLGDDSQVSICLTGHLRKLQKIIGEMVDLRYEYMKWYHLAYSLKQEHLNH
jgi:hypothetical protein